MLAPVVEGSEIVVPSALDGRFAALLAPDAQLERLWTGGAWLEGPVWLDSGAVLFSDIPNDRVLHWKPGGVTVETHPCGFANGHALDLDGAVIRCEHGRRCISRVEADGSVRVLVDRYNGRRLNSPNDVVVRSDGTIWFTDPPYGILSDREGHAAESELGDNYVFCFDPQSDALSIATALPEEPNGIAFSPDESVLYVADSSAALREHGGNHHILAFDVIGDQLASPRVFAVIQPGIADGFRIDVRGNVFTSSAEGILIYAPDGTLLGKVPVPEVVSNCVFGGSDGRRLFITASSSLYSIQLNTVGATARAGQGR